MHFHIFNKWTQNPLTFVSRRTFKPIFAKLFLVVPGPQLQASFVGGTTCVQQPTPHFRSILLLTVDMNHFYPVESRELEITFWWVSSRCRTAKHHMSSQKAQHTWDTCLAGQGTCRTNSSLSPVAVVSLCQGNQAHLRWLRGFS